MNISEMAVNDLKALVYDHLGNIESSQQSIRMLNQEIQNRNKPVEVKPE